MGGVMGFGDKGSRNSGRGELGGLAGFLLTGVVLRLEETLMFNPDVQSSSSSTLTTTGFPCEDVVDLRLLLRLLFLLGILF